MKLAFVRAGLAGIVLLLFGLWGWHLSADPAARNLVVSLLAGLAFGVVLQRSRFCFFCNFRDFLEKREADGLVAIIVALAFGAILYTAVMAAWAPVPQPDRLPPNAHIGPVGPVLALGALVFGVGMALSGSCLSAHLYRLGEGSPISLFALPGAALGFWAGFLTWNPLYLWSASESPVVWLPGSIGYAGALALTLLTLGAALIAVIGLSVPAAKPALAPQGLRGLAQRVLSDRWPPVVAGLLVGAIAAVAYFRVAPLGVTAELGSLARTAGSVTGTIPDTLLGLDELRGCATAVKAALVSPNGLFVVALVGGSFAAALAAGQFRPRWPRPAEAARGLAGGVLMGWGAMTALGCTIGVLLSGIHAGAVSGWVFLIFCAMGVWAGLRIMHRRASRHIAANPPASAPAS